MMSSPEESWERLVKAVLRSRRPGADEYGRPVGGIAANVPSSLANNREIDDILEAADEIQDENPNVARILCDYAYSVSQNLDPNSEGRGVLQFKAGLMSLIKQTMAKREGGVIGRNQDIPRLQEFYRRYRQTNDVEKLREEELRLRESAAFSGNLGELEQKTVKRKRVLATLKVLGRVLENLTNDLSPEEDRLVSDDMKHMIKEDEAMTEDLLSYNIIPLDSASTSNAIVSFSEVRAAVSAMKYFSDLPPLPGDFSTPSTRSKDMFDFLHFTFGFQNDNVSKQREHVIHVLANEQTRLRIPDESEPILDEAAVEKVFLKSLDNYIKWCTYLRILPVWSNLESVSKEKKLLFISLYFLIWGEGANVRFLPESICYIFHHMGRELEEILRQKVAQPAHSCVSENGVSFLNQVIRPLYTVIAAAKIAKEQEQGQARQE